MNKQIQSKAIFKLFSYVQMVIDEFALKAIVEQEDDDILISKVRARSSRSTSNSQNDKLIQWQI